MFGDDRIIGEPGLEPFLRYTSFKVRPAQHGLMLAVRFELLDETL